MALNSTEVYYLNKYTQLISCTSDSGVRLHPVGWMVSAFLKRTRYWIHVLLWSNLHRENTVSLQQWQISYTAALLVHYW